jgi:hypothetical protein
MITANELKQKIKMEGIIVKACLEAMDYYEDSLIDSAINRGATSYLINIKETFEGVDTMACMSYSAQANALAQQYEALGYKTSYTPSSHNLTISW